jgi:D-sedoheptulose 7-phosphate isomerase
MRDFSPEGDSGRGNCVRRMDSQLAEHLMLGKAVGDLLPVAEGVVEALKTAFSSGGILYTMGNGGSAADAQHFTGELIGHYKRDRQPLPAVTLSTDPTTMTCIGNDFAFGEVFARQVQALVREGDVVAAFTTTGRSANVVAALRTAREKGATTVLFGGGSGGPCLSYADFALLPPSEVTARVQETHTLLLHLISEELDSWAAATDPVGAAASFVNRTADVSE